MFPLIAGIFLILLGSFGLGVARRRHFDRHGIANGSEAGAQVAMRQPKIANVLIVFVSLLSIAAGLATAFV